MWSGKHQTNKHILWNYTAINCTLSQIQTHILYNLTSTSDCPPPPPPLKMLSLPTTTQETSTTFSMPKGIYNLLLACLGACQCPFSACPVGERIPSLSCHRPGWSPVIRCIICTEWSQHKASVVVHTSSDTDTATTLVCTVKGWWRWWWNQSS